MTASPLGRASRAVSSSFGPRNPQTENAEIPF